MVCNLSIPELSIEPYIPHEYLHKGTEFYKSMVIEIKFMRYKLHIPVHPITNTNIHFDRGVGVTLISTICIHQEYTIQIIRIFIVSTNSHVSVSIPIHRSIRYTEVIEIFYLDNLLSNSGFPGGLLWVPHISFDNNADIKVIECLMNIIFWWPYYICISHFIIVPLKKGISVVDLPPGVTFWFVKCGFIDKFLGGE